MVNYLIAVVMTAGTRKTQRHRDQTRTWWLRLREAFKCGTMNLQITTLQLGRVKEESRDILQHWFGRPPRNLELGHVRKKMDVFTLLLNSGL